MNKIAQGAEAIVYKDGNTIVKHRFSKTYRHPQLDKTLRKFRTRREAKVITRLCEKGICSPTLITVDDKNMKISMSYIDGQLLCDVLLDDSLRYGTLLGVLVGKLHTIDIIHGDLTTSNVIDVNGVLHLIDFGLSSFSIKVEDKAVELHLLKRALDSRHPSVANDVFEALLKAYLSEYSGGAAVVDRLEQKVSKRGRNKQK